MRPRTLLLNWVYYHFRRAALEAFKTAKGLSNANESLDIHLLLSSRRRLSW